MHHHHHHHDHHNHEVTADTVKERMFLLGILLNTLYVAGEFTAGIIYSSMGLLADAGHNLGDVSGLLISLAAFLLAKKRFFRNYTYGLRKGTVWASLVNALILLVTVGIITGECIRKIISPVQIEGYPVIITAGAGIVINGLTVFLFAKGRKHDLNVKGAYLHMLADTLVSAGVAVSGLVILWTGWRMADPLAGFAVAMVILFSTYGLLKESFRLAMDGVPGTIDQDEIRRHMLNHDNICDIHHVHIWAISTTENAITAHAVLNDLTRLEECRNFLRRELAGHGITHATFEFESPETRCPDNTASAINYVCT